MLDRSEFESASDSSTHEPPPLAPKSNVPCAANAQLSAAHLQRSPQSDTDKHQTNTDLGSQNERKWPTILAELLERE